ncbi:MAG: diguanylate cyclase domain-containing protein [Oribacterium sp.]
MNSIFYYVEASVFCMILLSIFFYKTVTSIYLEQRQIFFAHAVFYLILYITVDIFWALHYKGVLLLPFLFCFLLNLLQWFLASVCGYFWFIFMESMRGARYVEKSRNRKLIFLPVWIASLALLSSYFFHFPMKVGRDGCIDNMAYYSYMMLLPFFYVTTTGLRSLRQYLREEQKSQERQLLLPALYPVIIIFAGFLQALLLDIPLLCYAYVLVILIYYITMQDAHISQDMLTQLNNRNSLKRVLRNRFREPGIHQVFYFFMIDIDYFKSINDNYGHLEGDRALKLLADTLRTVSRRLPRRGCFLARYGGDEFILLCDCADDKAAFRIVQQIQQEAKSRSRNAGAPYTIEVSVGYVRRDHTIRSAAELIRKADEKLYQYKHVKQTANRA